MSTALDRIVQDVQAWSRSAESEFRSALLTRGACLQYIREYLQINNDYAHLMQRALHDATPVKTFRADATAALAALRQQKAFCDAIRCCFATQPASHPLQQCVRRMCAQNAKLQDRLARVARGSLSKSQRALVQRLQALVHSTLTLFACRMPKRDSRKSRKSRRKKTRSRSARQPTTTQKKRMSGGGDTRTHDRAIDVLRQFPMEHDCPTRTHEETYGEITESGMATLVAQLPVALDTSSIFYDVGSGYGRFALYLALATPCAAVVGVELHEGRHAKAAKMHRALCAAGTTDVAHLHFEEGDARQTSWRSLTHLYMCSSCFGAQLCTAIVRCCPPSLQCIVCLTQLVDVPGWELAKTCSVACTWSASSTAYFYMRA